MIVRIGSRILFSTLIFVILAPLQLLTSTGAVRAGVANSGSAAPLRLTLTAVPTLVDVGEAETFTLTANAWPSATHVTLAFVSPHHGFSGVMVWDSHCSCFRVAVALAKRVHPIEQGRAVATAKYGTSTAIARAQFQVRGLAPNGRDLAPGGTPALTAWVGDPSPVLRQVESFCAWVKTPDGIGVPGYRISFVVHYGAKAQGWTAGTTNPTGILCAHRSIGTPKPGVTVAVDVYAGSLRARTSFVPRS